MVTHVEVLAELVACLSGRWVILKVQNLIAYSLQQMRLIVGHPPD